MAWRRVAQFERLNHFSHAASASSPKSAPPGGDGTYAHDLVIKKLKIQHHYIKGFKLQSLGLVADIS